MSKGNDKNHRKQPCKKRKGQILNIHNIFNYCTVWTYDGKAVVEVFSKSTSFCGDCLVKIEAKESSQSHSEKSEQ